MCIRGSREVFVSSSILLGETTHFAGAKTFLFVKKKTFKVNTEILFLG